jgi:mRNA-degrading endonuclease YafQ of YafQ-DinJ toxin-antitoxin module
MSAFNQVLSRRQRKKLTKTNPQTIIHNSPNMSEEEAIKQALDSEDKTEVQFQKDLELALEQSKKEDSIYITPERLPNNNEFKIPDAPIKNIPIYNSLSDDDEDFVYKPQFSLSPNNSFTTVQQPSLTLSSVQQIIPSISSNAWNYHPQDQVAKDLEEKLKTNRQNQDALNQTLNFLIKQMKQLREDEARYQEDLDKLK